METWSNGKHLGMQADQLEEELDEELTKILTTNNPHAPQNIINYSIKEHCFKTTSVEQRAVHFVVGGSLLHHESEEAKSLRVKECFPEEKASVDTGAECEEDDIETVATPVEDGMEVEEQEGHEDKSDSPTSKNGNKEQKLRNQFNFWEMATQTFIQPVTEVRCQTEPPPQTNLSASSSKWEIYEAYVKEMERQEKSKEKQKVKKDNEQSKNDVRQMETQVHLQGSCQIADVNVLVKGAKLHERMVNLNIFDDTAQDFKYSDESRHQGGTLLPLWEFQYDKVRRLSVTALCWNSKYPDQFAVGMGSYDFIKNGKGLLVFYSLKNCNFPEYIYPTTSDILCLDIHEKHSHLAVVGFCDGCVAVYNLKEKQPDPVYKSTAKTGKHTDPVWQVRWQKDDMDNNHNFYSVSSDGRVVSWTLVKNELFFTDVIRVSEKSAFPEGPDVMSIIGCGISFDFHKQIDYLFLVGTEGGKIHKCSKTYSSQFLETYDAHSNAVHTVKWNPFHPKVFISCSSDWTVKMWDHTIKTPVLTFDLFADVGDISCSPFSSTVFAAVTTKGAVHVFDVNINRNEAVLEQAVVSSENTRLTCVEFNPIHPVIIVGDDQARVTCLKLPPNLRKKLKGKKGQDVSESPEEQVAKMDQILNLLRKPEESNV
ncbi:dynein, axonemal, intermediate chain 1, paralog 2 [Cololabis saira]|uniref:dynein, axonemal, intermediate chain 1, paralog 2 n=1 Tax=Cololabis saira TaxID=129043 RepID=UPI002AD40832|nr:dynein, axonemal, intermediate chain 1, paralog 2 [Cololabis saira]